MDHEVEIVKRAIVASGLDDWVHTADIVYAARQAKLGHRMLDGYPDDATVGIDQLGALRHEWLAQQERDALPIGIAATKELLRDGLVRIGDTTDGGFIPWDGSSADVESRIDSLVREARYPLLPGHLFWLENTPTGDENAGSE